MLDNVEMNVWADDNDYGQFTIQVSHKGTLMDAGHTGASQTNQAFALVVDGQVLEPRPVIVDIAQTASNEVTVAWSGVLYNSYKVQYIDEVDAPAAAWTDATGSIQMTNSPAAVALNMPANEPHRFYRVIRP